MKRKYFTQLIKKEYYKYQNNNLLPFDKIVYRDMILRYLSAMSTHSSKYLLWDTALDKPITLIYHLYEIYN